MSGAEVLFDDRLVARTNAAGEFGVWDRAATARTVTVRALHFEEWTELVEVGDGPIELLAALRDTEPVPSSQHGVSYLTDSRHRGRAGESVKILDPATRQLLFATTTRGDGAAPWPLSLEGRRVRIETGASQRPLDAVLANGGALPWASPRRSKAPARLDLAAMEASRGRLLVCNGIGDVRFGWDLSPVVKSVEFMAENGGREWVLAVTDEAVSLHEYEVRGRSVRLTLARPTGWALDPGELKGQLDVLASPWPSSVTFGPSLRDVLEWRLDSAARVRVDRDAAGPDVLRVSIDPTVVSLQSADSARDLRIVHVPLLKATSESRESSRRLVSFEGKGSVRVSFRYDTPMTIPVQLGIARRGTRFIRRVDVDQHGSIEFEGLCAGAFAVWLEREQDASDGIRGYEAIQLATVRPGESTELEMVWKRGAGLGGAKRVR